MIGKDRNATAMEGVNRRSDSYCQEDQLSEIKEAFDLFENERKEAISYHETKVILRALGFDMKSSEVYELIN